MTVEIDFLQKKNVDSNPYDSDKMASEFIQHFNNQAFSVGQQVLLSLREFTVHFGFIAAEENRVKTIVSLI